MKAVFVVTGASRGFGRHLAAQLIDSGLFNKASGKVDILLCARDIVKLEETRAIIIGKLKMLSSKSNCTVHTVAVDFGCDNQDKLMDFIFSHTTGEYTHAYLFNNAGTLGSLQFTKNLTYQDIKSSTQINLVSPMLLTARFLKQFSGCIKTVIVNVSSLAAIQPFATWGMYCATKAARDIAHRTIALEEPNVRVLNYAPGPIDTEMMTRVREEMPDFGVKQVYLDMHAENKLVNPEDSAKELFKVMDADEYENGAHIDYYDLVK